jgi:hypothetical protein
VLIVGLFWTLFPFYWLVTTALKPNTDMYRPEPLLVQVTVTLAHFQKVFFDSHFPEFFRNSAEVAGEAPIARVRSLALPVLFELRGDALQKVCALGVTRGVSLCRGLLAVLGGALHRTHESILPAGIARQLEQEPSRR